MIKNVIIALVAFVAIALVILWILNGGIGRTYTGIKNFSFFSTSTSAGFTLPWQPEGLLPRITDTDIFPTIETGGGLYAPGSADSQLAELQREYENLETDVRALKNIGNPSPHFKKVVISSGYAYAEDRSSDEESLVLMAAYENAGPVSLSGWSLQSAVTGHYTPIPGAASPFWMGAVNTISPVSLEPGHMATIVSGPSPVGMSFRENMCTGYLSQFQTFYPPLSLRCPSPSQELALSTENLQQYGPDCVDAAWAIPTCEFPKEIPNVSPQCRAHLQTILSYNGCVGQHASDSDFSENSWRLYIGSRTELWRDDHDAIRLLDAEGKVVDVYVY